MTMTTTCTAQNGEYQDLHDDAVANNFPCPACQPAPRNLKAERAEDRRIARAEGQMGR